MKCQTHLPLSVRKKKSLASFIEDLTQPPTMEKEEKEKEKKKEKKIRRRRRRRKKNNL